MAEEIVHRVIVKEIEKFCCNIITEMMAIEIRKSVISSLCRVLLKSKLPKKEDDIVFVINSLNRVSKDRDVGDIIIRSLVGFKEKFLKEKIGKLLKNKPKSIFFSTIAEDGVVVYAPMTLNEDVIIGNNADDDLFKIPLSLINIEKKIGR